MKRKEITREDVFFVGLPLFYPYSTFAPQKREQFPIVFFSLIYPEIPTLVEREGAREPEKEKKRGFFG